jgi:2-succinyl-5-enolpyruvyl-6-hydroxy-3-cyclohexene-1-carboxylate synthase
VIENWDSLLRVEEWAERHRPDVILRTGDLPTSKALREWISASAAAGAQVLHFDPLDSRRDPSSVNTARYASALAPSITAGPRGDDLWLNEWRAADAVAAATLTAKASQPLALSEPQIAACITSALSNRDLLFVAASMPVRDIESFGLLKDGPRVYANRGANGIDGTIASAAGLASASGQPTVLLLGDVTFAHDVASLATLRSVSTPFLGIVVNNGGGAIFDGLAIAAAGATYEEFVFTPPRLNIRAACEAWGLEHSLGTTIEELESALESLSSLAAPKILELTLDRKTSPAHRAELRAAVSAALLSS